MNLWQHQNMPIHKQVESFTVGKDPLLDLHLVPYDIAGSKAHAGALVKAGILTREEAESVKQALEELLRLWKKGSFVITTQQEDVHTAIEEWLTKKLGALGKKIHAGRSRNDQVATAIALYTKERLGVVEAGTKKLAGVMLSFGEENREVPMPGYTHLQQGMVSTLGLWAASYAELLIRDAELLAQTRALLDASPLGTAAGYGPSFTLDREAAAEELGFEKVVVTAPAAQGFRGKNEASALFACQQVMHSLGKVATDLLLFTTEEFGLLALSSKLCTGSSIMPQKENPDVLELVRAKSSVAAAKLHEAILISQHLPGGYNRDYQLLKEPLMEGLAIVEESLDIMALVMKEVKPAKGVKISPKIVAADKAAALAAQGVPFREAYLQVKGELSGLDSLTEKELLKNIAGKETLGAPGNPGFERLKSALKR